jgi:hypothetical protein
VVGVSDPGAETSRPTDTTSEAETGSSLLDRDLTRALQGGALAVAVVFALVSAVGFYTSAQRVIRVWVADAYQPVVGMGFNLVVLLAMLAVVAALTRRLTE